MKSQIHPRDIGLANPRMLKRRKSAPRTKTPEATIQAQVEEYLNIRRIPFLHIPAYILRAAFSFRPGFGADIGARAQAAEAIRGFPDLVLFNAECRAYLSLELKSSIGKMTHAQKRWQAALDTRKATSFEQAKGIIDAWAEACKKVSRE